MFKKPFKVKSQVQLKSTERKKLGAEILASFPSLSDEDILYFTCGKETVAKMKLLTFSEELVEVYIVDKLPMLFDIVDSKLKLPTVYMCWKFPHMVPTFTTHQFVLEKIKNGADLFLPGVILETQCFYDSLFERNDPCAVNTNLNASVVAVGQCLMSKIEACKSDAATTGGKLVKIYHCAGDHLCKLLSTPVPQIGPPVLISDESILVAEEEKPAEEQPQNIEPIVEPEQSIDVCETVTEIVSEKDLMNQLTEYCFLKAIKTSPKTVYPILPATFYANYMLANLPPGETLNIKKTKWKKFSEFLQEKSADGILQLETISKGEFRILMANTSHPAVREFVDVHNTEPVRVEVSNNGHPSIQQVFTVTAVTLPFFSKEGLKKSDELTRKDVRNILSEYVKREGLQDDTAKDRVKLDPILYQVVREENLSRADLLERLLDKMSMQHKVSTGDDVIVHKGKTPLVEFEVGLRSGNKKVTLISNLESYGIDVADFAKKLQQKAAASTTINATVPGKKGPQLQVQGNQILHAAHILVETFGIKEKFMRGLEKAPKSKKK